MAIDEIVKAAYRSEGVGECTSLPGIDVDAPLGRSMRAKGQYMTDTLALVMMNQRLGSIGGRSFSQKFCEREGKGGRFCDGRCRRR